jgi:type I restriction enzyme, S subunit
MTTDDVVSQAKNAEYTARLRRFKPYPAYKDSGVEWLGEIPAHWEVKALKRLASLRAGAAITAETIEETGEFPVFGGNGIRGFTSSYTHEGDFPLIGRQGALCGCVNFASGRFWASEHAVVAVPQAEVHPYWLSYLLRAMSLNSYSESAAQPGLAVDTISALHVPAPGCYEERTIAAFLDRETARMDALVGKKERLIELLQEKRTALITRAVTKGLDPNVPMKDSGVEWLGEIPVHWEVKKLTRLTKCLDGRRIPLNAEERGRMQGEYPYWGANSVVDYVDRWLFDEELVLLGEDGAPFFDRTKRVAFHVSGKTWVNNHAHVLRPGRVIEAAFLAHALNCVDYRAFIDGTTRDKLTQGDMNAIPIQCPDLTEQRAIAAFLDRETGRIDALVAKVRDAIDRLKELRTALISAAVTGKIDVREAAGAGSAGVAEGSG